MRDVLLFIVNMLGFWVYVDLMVGLDNPAKPAGALVSSFLYALVVYLLPAILDFFKFPGHFWAKLIIGSLFTFLLMWALSTFAPVLLTAGPGYLGGGDFVLFTLPKLIILPNAMLVLIVGSVIINLYSIIIEKYL